jgi:hypothetical protein
MEKTLTFKTRIMRTMIVDPDIEDTFMPLSQEHYEQFLSDKGVETTSLKIDDVLDSPQFVIVAPGKVIEVLDAELSEDYSFHCKLRYIPEVPDFSGVDINQEPPPKGPPDVITVGIDGKPPLFNSQTLILGEKCKDHYIELFYNKRTL